MLALKDRDACAAARECAGAGPSTRRGEAKTKGCRAASREGARTQRAGAGSDDGRHSRLISP